MSFNMKIVLTPNTQDGITKGFDSLAYYLSPSMVRCNWSADAERSCQFETLDTVSEKYTQDGRRINQN